MVGKLCPPLPYHLEAMCLVGFSMLLEIGFVSKKTHRTVSSLMLAPRGASVFKRSPATHTNRTEPKTSWLHCTSWSLVSLLSLSGSQRLWGNTAIIWRALCRALACTGTLVLLWPDAPLFTETARAQCCASALLSLHTGWYLNILISLLMYTYTNT